MTTEKFNWIGETRARCAFCNIEKPFNEMFLLYDPIEKSFKLKNSKTTVKTCRKLQTFCTRNCIRDNHKI